MGLARCFLAARYAAGDCGDGFGGLGGGGFGGLGGSTGQPISSYGRPGGGMRPSYTDRAQSSIGLAGCQRGELHRVVLGTQLGERVGVRLATSGD